MKAMSLNEFLVLTDILKHHLLNKKRIKYIEMQYDNRDGSVYCVTFKHWFCDDTVFTCVNRGDAKFDSLYEEITNWLDS